MLYNENRSQLELLTMKRILCFSLAAFLSLPIGAQETAPSENWTEINLAISDAVVIPGYAAFAEVSSVLADIAESFCAAPDAPGLEAFRNAFHAGMDGWQGVQHIQFGPITYFNWNYRVHYWPDEKGTGARQLDALIAAGNTDALQPDNFARESIGVQGFPALERLLFDEGSLQALQENPFRCQVAQAISQNISGIANGVHQRWVDEFRTTVANADERGFFESAEDATIDFLKSQVEPVRRVQQQKIEEVIGDSAARVRVRRAESWRSARSLRNIRVNVAALASLFNGVEDQSARLRDVLHAEDVEKINTLFASLHNGLETMPDSYEVVLAEAEGHKKLLAIAADFDALFEAFEAGLKNTDLYLGFNSLDGD